MRTATVTSTATTTRQRKPFSFVIAESRRADTIFKSGIPLSNALGDADTSWFEFNSKAGSDGSLSWPKWLRKVNLHSTTATLVRSNLRDDYYGPSRHLLSFTGLT